MDIGSTKGSQPVYLYYAYTECEGYYFDPTLLNVQYDQDGIVFNPGDNLASQQRLTIDVPTQSSLPLNEYFYLKVTGSWRFEYAPSDIISITMIYALRYITVLSLNINVNSYLLTSS